MDSAGTHVITSERRRTCALRLQAVSADMTYPNLGLVRLHPTTLESATSFGDWTGKSDRHAADLPPMYKHKLALLMRYATEYDTAVVPDPYYGGNEGFNTVLDYCEDACEGLLEVVKKRASVYIPGSAL